MPIHRCHRHNRSWMLRPMLQAQDCEDGETRSDREIEPWRPGSCQCLVEWWSDDPCLLSIGGSKLWGAGRNTRFIMRLRFIASPKYRNSRVTFHLTKRVWPPQQMQFRFRVSSVLTITGDYFCFFPKQLWSWMGFSVLPRNRLCSIIVSWFRLGFRGLSSYPVWHPIPSSFPGSG